MKKLIILLMLLFVPGCLLYPRVVQCNKCGKVQGRIGGLLPGQGSQCHCGGYIEEKRSLTQAQWQEAKKRGYVTLDDGEPIE
jgi:hypothetical protein